MQNEALLIQCACKVQRNSKVVDTDLKFDVQIKPFIGIYVNVRNTEIRT